MAHQNRSVIRRSRLAIGAVSCIAAVLAAMPALAQKPANAAIPASPVGLWIDQTGRGAIEIAPCQGKTTLCGWIVWLQEPLDKRGKPLRDQLNEDRSQRNRPICGLQIIGELRQQRDGSWDLGWIYDPERGESFDLAVRMRGSDSLQVTGYKGFKFLSETFQWRRAGDPPPPRCSA